MTATAAAGMMMVGGEAKLAWPTAFVEVMLLLLWRHV